MGQNNEIDNNVQGDIGSGSDLNKDANFKNNQIVVIKDVVAGADLRSFTIEHCQAKDANNAYVNGKKD